jgi:choline dehydrogenase-like flavoprotein
MPTNLPRLVASQQPGDQVVVQETEFTIDAVGRYICNTWDEAVNSGGLPFDAVVIGAGMFGAYCAEKIYRSSGLRVLVLDAGCLVTEHVQNLSRIGLNNAGLKLGSNGKPVPIAFNADDPGTREWVWGIPWRSSVPFPGLAYCLGGRSIYWGGWAPRLTKEDLDEWPKTVREYLQNPAYTPCPDSATASPVDEYCRTEKEIGTVPTADYISGPLYEALKSKAEAAVGKVDSVDAIEDAPLAVQASQPASGLFSFDKWSSAPIFIDALREDAERAIRIDSQNPNWNRRLVYVPRVHVTRLQYANGRVTRLEAWVNGQKKTLDITDKCAVVLANGTIESTRLALESFPTPLMGRNLMAHLRTNTTVRIHRSALGVALAEKLTAAALLVRGSNDQGRYHLQVTAAAVQGGSEDTMWRAIPDIELLDQTLASQKEDWIVVTLRGIGEMKGSKDLTAPKVNGATPSWIDLSDQTEGLPVFSNPPQEQIRRAWVNLVKTDGDETLWKTMDAAAIALARKLADDDDTKFELVEQKRDGIGTTHHEAGTLWMGTDLNHSVTNLDGRFHHVQNAWVAGPAIFPTLGSANPSLTAITLARRTAHAIVKQSAAIEADFALVGGGGLAGWQMSASGSFIELGGGIIEATGGIGLLWFTKEQFEDFILRVDFRLNSPNDNSGVFIRIPALGKGANDWKPAAEKGYEIQIDNTGYNPDTKMTGDLKHATGAIYQLAAASEPMPSIGQWHTFEIEAVGPKITVKLNNKQVSQLLIGTRLEKGYIGLQNHHDGSKVQFKRIRIQKLATAKPAALMLDGARRDLVVGLGTGRRGTRKSAAREAAN